MSKCFIWSLQALPSECAACRLRGLVSKRFFWSLQWLESQRFYAEHDCCQWFLCSLQGLMPECFFWRLQWLVSEWSVCRGQGLASIFAALPSRIGVSVFCFMCNSLFRVQSIWTTTGAKQVASLFPFIGFQCLRINVSCLISHFMEYKRYLNPWQVYFYWQWRFLQRYVFVSTFPAVIRNHEY